MTQAVLPVLPVFLMSVSTVVDIYILLFSQLNLNFLQNSLHDFSGHDWASAVLSLIQGSTDVTLA